jgi:hypothetical protein
VQRQGLFAGTRVQARKRAYAKETQTVAKTKRKEKKKGKKSAAKAEQERRFLARAADLLRYWKLSQIDYKTLPFTPPEAGKRKKRQPGTPESLTFHHKVSQIY